MDETYQNSSRGRFALTFSRVRAQQREYPSIQSLLYFPGDLEEIMSMIWLFYPDGRIFSILQFAISSRLGVLLK